MICEGFNIPVDVAERQDYTKCMSILLMRSYDAALSREERGEKLTGDDYRLIIPLERAAGISGARAIESRN